MLTHENSAESRKGFGTRGFRSTCALSNLLQHHRHNLALREGSDNDSSSPVPVPASQFTTGVKNSACANTLSDIKHMLCDQTGTRGSRGLALITLTASRSYCEATAQQEDRQLAVKGNVSGIKDRRHVTDWVASDVMRRSTLRSIGNRPSGS